MFPPSGPDVWVPHGSGACLLPAAAPQVAGVSSLKQPESLSESGVSTESPPPPQLLSSSAAETIFCGTLRVHTSSPCGWAGPGG